MTACRDSQDSYVAYYRRELRLAMLGPLASLLIHLIVLTILTVAVPRQQPTRSAFLPIVRQVEPTPLPPIEPKPSDSSEPIDHAGEMDLPLPPAATPPEARPPGPDRSETDEAPMLDEMPEVPFRLSSLELVSSAVVPSESLLRLPVAMANRSGEARRRVGEANAMGRPTPEAIQRALAWLASVQEGDGSWAGDPAHTGLALLAFMGYGETPSTGQHSLVVRRGLNWLTNEMLASGDGPIRGDRRGYSHGIATYALAEACSLSPQPRLRAALEQGVAVIMAGQQAGGGFDYDYREGGRWDTSVTGWQVQAMKAATLMPASPDGLEPALDKSAAFLRQTSFANGRFGYASPGTGGNMTGVGAVCLQLIGQGKSGEALAACETIAGERFEILRRLRSNGTFAVDGARYLYGLYYDTQAMFNRGGRNWRRWAEQFQAMLWSAQAPEGYWDFAGEAGHFGADQAG